MGGESHNARPTHNNLLIASNKPATPPIPPNNREADKSASEGRRADEAETTTLSHPIKLIASNKPHALNP